VQQCLFCLRHLSLAYATGLHISLRYDLDSQQGCDEPPCVQCGGSPAAFSAAQPLLSVMGGRSIHCGGPSAGQAAKLCNNLVLAGVIDGGCCSAAAFVVLGRLRLCGQDLPDGHGMIGPVAWTDPVAHDSLAMSPFLMYQPAVARGQHRAQRCCAAVSMAGVAEGLSLGRRLGLDPALLSSVFNSSSAQCWASDSYNPCPVCRPGQSRSRAVAL